VTCFCGTLTEIQLVADRHGCEYRLCNVMHV